MPSTVLKTWKMNNSTCYYTFYAFHLKTFKPTNIAIVKNKKT